jgi:hypothetical protein
MHRMTFKYRIYPSVSVAYVYTMYLTTPEYWQKALTEYGCGFLRRLLQPFVGAGDLGSIR